MRARSFVVAGAAIALVGGVAGVAATVRRSEAGAHAIPAHVLATAPLVGIDNPLVGSGVVAGASGIAALGRAGVVIGAVNLHRDVVLTFLDPGSGSCGVSPAPFTRLVRNGDVVTAHFGSVPATTSSGSRAMFGCPATTGIAGSIALAVSRHDLPAHIALHSCPGVPSYDRGCATGVTADLTQPDQFVIDGWSDESYNLGADDVPPCVIRDAAAPGASPSTVVARVTLPPHLGSAHVALVARNTGAPATATYAGGPELGSGAPQSSELAAGGSSDRVPGFAGLVLSDHLRVEAPHCVQQWIVDRVGSEPTPWHEFTERYEALRITVRTSGRPEYIDARLLDATPR